MDYYKFTNLSEQKRIDFWITNLLVAHSVFTNMPDKKIVAGLSVWCIDKHDCGSPACFGGWIARIPYFKNFGVEVGQYDGSPQCGTTDRCGFYLFGKHYMFDTRKDWEEDSDVEVILTRIESALNDLLQYH